MLIFGPGFLTPKVWFVFEAPVIFFLLGGGGWEGGGGGVSFPICWSLPSL